MQNITKRSTLETLHIVTYCHPHLGIPKRHILSFEKAPPSPAVPFHYGDPREVVPIAWPCDGQHLDDASLWFEVTFRKSNEKGNSLSHWVFEDSFLKAYLLLFNPLWKGLSTGISAKRNTLRRATMVATVESTAMRFNDLPPGSVQ